MNGEPVQALNFSLGERSEATLATAVKAGAKLEFEIEMACNTTLGAYPQEKPYNSISPYVLDQCEIAVFDPLAWNIYLDFLVLQQLEADLATTNDTANRAFAAELLYQLNHFCNQYDRADAKTWQPAHKILLTLFANQNGTKVHELSAVGEGHLDLAWWWPVAETARKIVRTASNQVSLLDAYPAYRFVCSQAYFYEQLKELQPHLYERVKKR